MFLHFLYKEHRFLASYLIQYATHICQDTMLLLVMLSILALTIAGEGPPPLNKRPWNGQEYEFGQRFSPEPCMRYSEITTFFKDTLKLQFAGRVWGCDMDSLGCNPLSEKKNLLDREGVDKLKEVKVSGRQLDRPGTCAALGARLVLIEN
ncbi:hypothetical protein RRG08_000207 [Elysia crispata]|uniref:Uncharacterized protein n=1 Tax=Elysia crispata TaxID=231223 RepID=A0AAE0YUR9_9GAST|nr:hypothetical protein RRG08_000207 [Elysia crispata]